MTKFLFTSLLVSVTCYCDAQYSYVDSIIDWQAQHNMSLTVGEHPISIKDTGYVRYFKPDIDYKVTGVFEPTIGRTVFFMENKHGGKRRAVKEYGTVYFNLMGAALTLHVYRFMNDVNEDIGDLFIPFTDRTNYKTTFLGGRYIDIPWENLKNNKMVIDFNKCYNPHTAYEKGYPYIIPPKVNDIRIEINAGEKIYGHEPGY
jgi:uncharacterized protein